MASVFKETGRAGSKPWRVDWTEHGRRRSRRFPSKGEASAYARQVEAGDRPTDSRATITDWYTEWVVDRRRRWSTGHADQVAWYGERWILPYLGGHRVAELRPRDVARWVAATQADGASGYTVGIAVKYLRQCLKEAVRQELAVRNATAGQEIPDHLTRRERVPFTLQEVEAIRAAIERSDHRLAVSLMAYAGLRPGEVRALRWRDILPGAIRVARGSGRADGRTKTGVVASVPLLWPVAADLEHVDRGGPDDLVAGIGASWDTWTKRVWRPALHAVGAEGPPYALRHTHASLLIAEGLDVFHVAQRLRHKKPTLVLEVYGHLFAEAQLHVGEPLEDAVRRVRGHSHHLGS